MKSIAFFNNKGGVGKTSLIYHLAWMYADLGQRVLLVHLAGRGDSFDGIPPSRMYHTLLES